jgi:hypothetical protein
MSTGTLSYLYNSVLVRRQSWPPIGLDTLVRNNFKDEERERRCDICKHEKVGHFLQSSTVKTRIQLVSLSLYSGFYYPKLFFIVKYYGTGTFLSLPEDLTKLTI